jgi:hypothetical protein
MESIWQFFSSWEKKDVVTALIAVYGAIVATLNFAWPRIQELRARRASIFRALQGEKEAIAEVAYRVTKNEWDTVSDKFRKKLVSALSMAFGMESSDRAKAYVVAAFRHLQSHGHSSELIGQLKDIEAIFKNYDAIVKDRDFREKRLDKLTAVIESLETSKCNQK